MMRCTIELLPGGNEMRARTIGLIEISRIGGDGTLYEYAVVLKKTPPFAGALIQAWRRGRVQFDEVIAARVSGHHRTRRGCYDLLYRALKACGLESRVTEGGATLPGLLELALTVIHASGGDPNQAIKAAVLIQRAFSEERREALEDAAEAARLQANRNG